MTLLGLGLRLLFWVIYSGHGRIETDPGGTLLALEPIR
jgi:hypothetical protein